MEEKQESEVKDGLRKQDYIIGDATGATTLTVWEKNVGMLKEGYSYRIAGLMVRIFNGKKYLSMPKEDSEIESIDDIGDVEDEFDDDELKLEDAVVVGVMLLDTYSSCFSCKGKVMVTAGCLGKCSKCNMTLCVDRCTQEMSAKLVVEGRQKEKTTCKNLAAFSTVLQEICQNAEVTEETLLIAQPFDAMYSDKNVITGISHKVSSGNTILNT